MRKKESLYTVIIMLAGILVNYGGKVFAQELHLPLWLDSIGTGIVACVLGPVNGALCGVTNNIIYGMSNPNSYYYATTSVTIGLIIGIGMKKGMFRHLFGAITVSVFVSLASVIISTPFNVFYWNGLSGNVWGDGLYGMLTTNGWNHILATALGELFVDFPDKVITVLITYGVMRMPFFTKITSNKEHIAGKKKKEERKVTKMLSLILLISISILSMNNYVKASQDSSDYAQTIYNSDNGLVAGEANDIVETANGYIWIGTNDKGVSLYVNGKITNTIDKKTGLSSNSIRCIEEDSKGNYYVGTSDALCVISLVDGVSVIKTFPDITYANKISVSKEDEISIVTNAGSLFLLKDLKVQGQYELEKPESYYTSCYFQKDDQLLVATSGNEVYQWDMINHKRKEEGIISTGKFSNIHSMQMDEENHLWLCTDSGVGYVDKENQFIPVKTGAFNSSVDNMTQDYQGNLYSGTDNGLDIIDEENRKNIQNKLTKKLENNRIRCLMVDSKNHLWVSTTAGVGLLEVYPNGKIRTYSPKKGTIDNRFRSTLELKDGTIVAAENTGLDFIKDGKVVATIGKEDGLTNPQILSLMEMDDGIYC